MRVLKMGCFQPLAHCKYSTGVLERQGNRGRIVENAVVVRVSDTPHKAGELNTHHHCTHYAPDLFFMSKSTDEPYTLLNPNAQRWALSILLQKQAGNRQTM